jgi:hypothetical protein
MTGVFYAAIFLVTFVAARRFRFRESSLLTTALVVGTLALGGDSYVKNLISRGNPFYPALGA